MTRPTISLMTDFGLQDSYVGQMKGVIAGINSEAAVIDITHAIPPQNLVWGAIALCDALDAFPAGTIHVAVVDPGVGSSRRAIAAEIGPLKFVCPDNGLLTLVLRKYPLIRAVVLDREKWGRAVSAQTFHGRDLFAPVAATWSLGHDLTIFGPPLTSPLVTLPIAEYQQITHRNGHSGTIRGHFVAVDHFGNAITDIPESAIPGPVIEFAITFGDQRLTKISRCYADESPGDTIALFGSNGRLEIAVVNGSAARQFGLRSGEEIAIDWCRKPISIVPSVAKDKLPKGVFVTGTDTDVGKTHIATMIIRALKASGFRVGAYKPVCSGAIKDSSGVLRWNDVDQLQNAIGPGSDPDWICKNRFVAPVSPPLAAKQEGRSIDFDNLVTGVNRWIGNCEILVVEGAGGLLSPVTDRETVADLALSMGYPLLLVGRCGLGTINQTLLTIEAARSRGLQIAGVVLNQASPADDLSLAESNAIEIERRGNTAVLGIVETGNSVGLQRHGRPVTIHWSKIATVGSIRP